MKKQNSTNGTNGTNDGGKAAKYARPMTPAEYAKLTEAATAKRAAEAAAKSALQAAKDALKVARAEAREAAKLAGTQNGNRQKPLFIASEADCKTCAAELDKIWAGFRVEPIINNPGTFGVFKPLDKRVVNSRDDSSVRFMAFGYGIGAGKPEAVAHLLKDRERKSAEAEATND